MDKVSVVLNHLHLAQIDKTDGPFCRTDEVWLVILVEDQHLPVQNPIAESPGIPQLQYLSMLFTTTILLLLRSELRAESTSKVSILTKPEQCMNSSPPREIAT